jgi:hypothetical protein
MTEFAGNHFCGTTGGKPFLTAERVDPSTKKCKSGYVACSDETSAENTICVRSGEQDQCPITFMTFTEDEDDIKYYKNDTENYVVQKVEDDTYFVYSKTRGDSLPITSTSVEYKPCLDPIDVSRSPSVNYQFVYYETELDKQKEDCGLVPQFDERYDTRFEKLDFSVSEYDVQDDNGVIDIIYRQPLARDQVQIHQKDQIKYDFWGRSTIPWSLECEATIPRGEVYDIAAQEADKFNMNYGLVMGFSIFLCVFIGFTLCFSFTVGCTDKNDDAWETGPVKCFSIAQFLVQGGVCIFLICRINWMFQEITQRYDAMVDLTIVNGCSDMFTTI